MNAFEAYTVAFWLVLSWAASCLVIVLGVIWSERRRSRRRDSGSS